MPTFRISFDGDYNLLTSTNILVKERGIDDIITTANTVFDGSQEITMDSLTGNMVFTYQNPNFVFFGVKDDRGNLISRDAGGIYADYTSSQAHASFYGSRWADILIGGDSEDTLWGGGGNDELRGGFGGDSLSGADGDDILDGGADGDRMAGGYGNDTYVVDSDLDVIEGEEAHVPTVLDGGNTDLVRSYISYELGANLENLTLVGDAIFGTGNSLDNVITGNDRNNILDGGTGNDTFIGGAGDDRYVFNGGDLVIETANGGTDSVISSVSTTLNDYVEELYLTSTAFSGSGGAQDNKVVGNELGNILAGGGGSDSLYGMEGNDMLVGGDNADTLDGGEGDDRMLGFGGDDLYTVDSILDVVEETENNGTDTVISYVDYALGENVESLSLVGEALVGDGNSLDNLIYGNFGNNTLNGGLGADLMVGGRGDDFYQVDNINDTVAEEPDEPTLPRDQLPSSGNDTVWSTINYTLTANVENLIIAGTATYAAGNELDNVITGNTFGNEIDGGAGVDTMIGGGGDDYYYVDDYRDVVVEEANSQTRAAPTDPGVDTVFASVSYKLSANVEKLTLTDHAYSAVGNDLNNTLTGTEEYNLLDGGKGADMMAGGLGDDLYYVDNAGDLVIEDASLPGRGRDGAEPGNDTVSASISYALTANVENLTLTGSAISGKGNGLANEITGSWRGNVINGAAGNDTLYGLGGSDTIYGGYGDDVLVGGRGKDRLYAQYGADTLVFGQGDTGASRNYADTVVYFNGRGGDRIDLTNWDANENSDGDQDFTFIGKSAFHGEEGELRYIQQGKETWLVGDTDGDKKADLMIHFESLINFRDEFILG